MAANVAGMIFLPYYNHIMKLLNTNEQLKSTVKGNVHVYKLIQFLKTHASGYESENNSFNVCLCLDTCSYNTGIVGLIRHC